MLLLLQCRFKVRDTSEHSGNFGIPEEKLAALEPLVEAARVIQSICLRHPQTEATRNRKESVRIARHFQRRLQAFSPT